MILAQLRNILIALVIGLLVGGIGGFYLKSKLAKAEIVTAVEKERREGRRAIADMQAKEAALQDQIERSRENADAARNAITAAGVRVVRKADAPGVRGKTVCDADAGSSYLLDGRTVRVLNAARRNAAHDPASGVDVQGKASAGTQRTGDRH